MKLVILKKAGEPVEVAINPALITDVRSTPGQFTEIHFGEHRVTVEGSFRQIVGKLRAEDSAQGGMGAPDPARSWIQAAKV